MTYHRKRCKTLHVRNRDRFGIISCTEDKDLAVFAGRIHAAIVTNEPLPGKLVCVVRPSG